MKTLFRVVFSVALLSSPALADEAFEAAAKKGQQQALEEMMKQGMGFETVNGETVIKDPAKALKFQMASAEQGNANAQYNLGLMHATGDGVPQDYAKALEWYTKAADQGHMMAQYNLGWMYMTGEGVQRDDARAAQWYQRAAENGQPNAQYNLGNLYALGRGVKQDYKQAYIWFARAEAKQHPLAKRNKELAAKELDAKSLAEAERELKKPIAGQGKPATGPSVKDKKDKP